MTLRMRAKARTLTVAVKVEPRAPLQVRRKRALERVCRAMIELATASGELFTYAPVGGCEVPEYYECNRVWHAAQALAKRLERR